MSSDSAAPALLFLGLIAITASECDGRRNVPVQSGAPVRVAVLEEAPAAWDERSDCHPGAAPNSLANALDPLKAHCDRAKAVATLAPLAAMAVAPMLGRGAAAGAAAGGRSTVSAARVAGAAANSAARSEAAEGAAALSRRAFRIAPRGRQEYVAESDDAASDGSASYRVQRSGQERFDVRSQATGRSYPVKVRSFEADLYEVEGSDGSVTIVSSRELDRWYASGSPPAEIWEYESR